MSIDRLSAEDRLMLGASKIWPQDIGALALLDGRGLFDADGRFRIEAVHDVIGARLHVVPRFRQVIYEPRRGLGAPFWVDEPGFDLNDHVRVLPLAAPAGEAELLLATEELLRRPLDPSRPLWEMWFLTGLPQRRVGWFVRIHHALADGMAAMTTVAAFLDPDPEVGAEAARPWRPAPVPSAAALLADNLRRHVGRLAGMFSMLLRPRIGLRRLREAWPATRELLAEEPASATSLDRLVGPGRRFALVRSSIDVVRAIGRVHDATVNDVLLAVTAGGLRALLVSRGEAVEGVVIRIFVPVSLRARLRGPQQGNLIAQMVVPLALGVADPGQRLRQIAAETTKRKVRTRTSLGTLFRGRIVRGLMLKAVIRQRVNVTSASIPGPTASLYLAGAQVLEVFPLLPLIGNVPLGVGALSYAGTFNIGVAADQEAYPDIGLFADGVREELDTLAALSVASGRTSDRLSTNGSPPL